MSLPKLQHLWRSKASILAGHDEIITRANRITEIAGRWDHTDYRANVSALIVTNYKRAAEAEIPENNLSVVQAKLSKFYAEHSELNPYADQIDEVLECLHVTYRDERYRVSSNARNISSHETDNTIPLRGNNPESYFVSYNFPFEIIQFYFSCQGADQSPDFGRLRSDSPERRCEGRFITKFIWMVANRAKQVPILSLRSFRTLAPVLHALNGDIDWGQPDQHWNLTFEEFVAAWPEVADKLCQTITGEPYKNLGDKGQLELTRFLFVATLSDAAAKAKNALAMLQTGSRAMIFYGPPGTGKTHDAREVTRRLLEAEDRMPYPPSAAADTSTFLEERRFSQVFGNGENASQPPVATTDGPHPSLGCWEFVQFHPSYSYQDFVGGIVPNVGSGKTVKYTLQKGVFKHFCEAAEANPQQPFVFIIDEINRANLSAVFGELLYALEYRGAPVNIPFFHSFVIPPNVYLIGTMNTVDKSLDAFDLALRRRFLFMKHLPDMNALFDWNAQHGKDDPSAGFEPEAIQGLVDRANALNRALVASEPEGLGLPKDHGVGQAYFMKIRDFCPREEGLPARITEFAREQLWLYHLQPLIEEYLGAESDAKQSVTDKLREQFVNEENDA